MSPAPRGLAAANKPAIAGDLWGEVAAVRVSLDTGVLTDNWAEEVSPARLSAHRASGDPKPRPHNRRSA